MKQAFLVLRGRNACFMHHWKKQKKSQVLLCALKTGLAWKEEREGEQERAIRTQSKGSPKHNEYTPFSCFRVL